MGHDARANPGWNYKYNPDLAKKLTSTHHRKVLAPKRSPRYEIARSAEQYVYSQLFVDRCQRLRSLVSFKC